MVVALRRFLGGLVVVALMAPALAQPSSESTPDLAREVEALRRSVERAVVLLDRALAHQGAQLLLKRIELKERRVVPLESELRRARDELAGAESEIERLEIMLDNAEDSVSEDIRAGTDRADSENREMKSGIEHALVYARAQVETELDRVRRLDDDLSERLEKIEILEDSLERRLEQLP